MNTYTEVRELQRHLDEGIRTDATSFHKSFTIMTEHDQLKINVVKQGKCAIGRVLDSLQGFWRDFPFQFHGLR